MKGSFKNKLIFYMLGAFLFLFFVNDFSLIDAEKTAIIVGMSIDECEDKEKGNYTLAFQVAMPQGKEESQKPSQNIIKASGFTISEAISKMSLETGWYPKLSYCNLVIVSDKLATSNIMDVLEFFISTEKMQDSALLAITTNIAADVLTSTAPLDSLSTFSLQKIMLGSYFKSSDVAVSSLKDFSAVFYSFGADSYITNIEIINDEANKKDKNKGEDKQKNTGTASGDKNNDSDKGSKEANNSSGENDKNNKDEAENTKTSEGEKGDESQDEAKSSDSEKSKAEKDKDAEKGSGTHYNTFKTAIFDQGRLVSMLTKSETECFNLLIKQIKNTPFLVRDVAIPSENKETPSNYELNISSGKASVKQRLVGDKILVSIKLNLIASILDTDTNFNSLSDLTSKGYMPDELKDATKKQITTALTKLTLHLKNANSDILRIGDELMRFDNKNFKQFLTRIDDPDKYLQNTVFDITVSVAGIKPHE